jgi:hypothetical protein
MLLIDNGGGFIAYKLTLITLLVNNKKRTGEYLLCNDTCN